MGTHTTYYTPQPSNTYTTPHHAIVGARIRHGANPRSTTKTPPLGTPPLVHDRSIGSYRNPLVREGYPRRARDFATHGDDDAVLHPARDDDDDGDRRVEA